LLADPDSDTIKRYGILNTVSYEATGPNGQDPEVLADLAQYVTVTRASERFHGIAYPGTFMLDAQGFVTERFFEDFYQERYTVANILLKLGTGGRAIQAAEMNTSHVQIRTYPSDAVVAPGERFSLAVEIDPEPGMHVYAPGDHSYRVVTLRIDPQPKVRVLPIQHPASETYYFEPLDERVPVYQKPFTLLQEVVPEVDREFYRGKDQLTITGSLDYQACDDKICYNPMSVPLSWTVQLKPFVGRPGGRTR